MSYLVLARKWRPQRFEEVIGQPHLIQTLRNAISAGRLAHAYLFSGPRGVGKTSVARILAKALNCQQGPSPTPCNECESCREITEGAALDVLEIDGASNRGINEIRELRENIRYLPSKSPYKIYIIDEVHMLTSEAFNALLKTLEEPPAHVIFIFATTEAHRVPMTILSRCQRFDFRRLAVSAIVETLRRIAKDEEIRISDTSLRVLAREAEGSMRDAESLLEQMIVFSGKQIDDSALLQVLGVIDRQALLDTAAALLSGDAARCLEIVERLSIHGHNLRRFCQELAAHFRDLLVVKICESPEELVDLTAGEVAELREQAERLSDATLQQFLHFLVRGEEEIRRASNPKLVMEMTLLRLIQLPRLMEIDRLIVQVRQLEERLNRGVEPGALLLPGERGEDPGADVTPYMEPPHEEPPEPLPGVADGARGSWKDLVARIREQRPALAGTLERGKVKEIGSGRLELDFSGHNFDYELVTERENMALLQSLGREILGPQVEISVAGGRREEMSERRAATDRQRRLRQKALRHPLVTEALEIFGGEVVDVKIGPDKPS
ncbi:MAG TPA: DNA polymerase III subunit gamma/tau [Syntrophobacteria bacterium]|nr:DNA polymerase III subunit gamma/tau [Syntrophobacteria bacterium]